MKRAIPRQRKTYESDDKKEKKKHCIYLCLKKIYGKLKD
jgi:hypothetical protein